MANSQLNKNYRVLKRTVLKSGSPRTVLSRRRVKGFTLIEILVSVAIMITLAAAVMFWSTDAEQKAAFTRANMEADQIATGAFLFYQTNGVWPDDAVEGMPTDFYNSTYVPITGTAVQDYLGADYRWDWQNWGNDDVNGSIFPNSVWPHTTYSAGCWQTVDLERGKTVAEGGAGLSLVVRQCVRDVCFRQKYCDKNTDCWNTAAARDIGNIISPDYVGIVSDGYSPVCENCSNETECGNKFID